MLRFVFATLMLAILSTLPSSGGAVENGTRAIVSDLSYWGVITRLEAAIKRQNLRIVSRESVRGAERQKKLGIPGNMVIGAFGDEYTTRILRANVAAGIEAPIRFYVTHDPDDKTTTLWYRRPSWVLAPYSDRTGDLRAVGEELDRIMAAIAAEATDTKKRTKPLLVKRGAGKHKAAKPAPDKPKAATPVAAKPGPRKPERVAGAASGRTVKKEKPAAKPAEPAPKLVKTAATPNATPKAATEGAPPRKRAAPTPLTPAAPVARTGPKPLTAAALKSGEETPQERAKTPVETATAGRTADRAGPRKPKPPTAKRDPDRDAITLTPLMLQLQGQ